VSPRDSLPYRARNGHAGCRWVSPVAPRGMAGHDCLVILTGNELTIASSAVAALAIVGGYLGVRSANRNAVKIAREERSSRRGDELNALKRVTYVRCVSALLELNTANTLESTSLSHPSRRIDAAQAAHAAVVDMELIAPDRLRDLAFQTMGSASQATKGGTPGFTRLAIMLREAMASDLRGLDIPSLEELDRAADTAISNTTAFDAFYAKGD
jgi:hypothetical protein